MESLSVNKEFITNYFNSVSGVAKSRALIEKYATDEELICHVDFFEAAFPRYELFADEVIAEGNRVVVKARFKGTHQGDLNGISPTYKTVEFAFVIRYEIENSRIIDHWMLADEKSLLEQLGVIHLAEASH